MREKSALIESSIQAKVTPEQFLSNATKNQLPLAIWRKPNAENYHISVSFSNDTRIEEESIENLMDGFIFCPFIASEKNPKHFIKNDILLKIKADNVLEINESLHHNSNNIREALFEKTDAKVAFYSTSENRTAVSQGNRHLDYVQYVSEAVQQIKSGDFEKVVPTRKESIALPKGFDAFSFFKVLESSYPNAFIYLVSLPDQGTWIGATPENLISIQKNSIFKTTALAGTQKYQDDMDLVDAAWRQKEIEEQAMVSRYIINCFKKIRLREFEEHGPKTVKAGNLMHLKTDFIVHMEEVNFPQLGSVMLNLLHPTSAICGMPQEPALKFIMEKEGFDREYFSGFLGPVNTENDTDIFVNLRCMKVISSRFAETFAGAGVTIDSIPEKEWLETEMKMDTLLKLL